MRKVLIAGLFLLLSLQPAKFLSAQICSCGGAPLLSSLEFGGVYAGKWHLSLGYEYHNISDVVSGSQQQDQDTRWQVTQAGLFKVSYRLSSSFSISTLLTVVQKERAAGDHLIVRGIGDGLLMANLSLIRWSPYTPRELVISGGFKAPLGNSGLRYDGRLVSADLQPTSGAWDGIISIYAYQSFISHPISLLASTAYRWTGLNEPYTFSDLAYKFGNEFIASVGMGYAFNDKLSATLSGQYHATRADRFGGFRLPSTGGEWVDLVPGVNLMITRTLTMGLLSRLPLYRNLEGPIQLATSYTIAVALYYEMGGT
jgi:hypothetical protein